MCVAVADRVNLPVEAIVKQESFDGVFVTFQVYVVAVEDQSCLWARVSL